MNSLLDLYELDLELSCRLFPPNIVADALIEQGLMADATKKIVELCIEKDFRLAAEFAISSNCDFQQLNQYLEEQSMKRKLYINDHK